MYRPIPYPAWRYHVDGRSLIVQTPIEDDILKREDGWYDQPGEAADAAKNPLAKSTKATTQESTSIGKPFVDATAPDPFADTVIDDGQDEDEVYQPPAPAQAVKKSKAK